MDTDEAAEAATGVPPRIRPIDHDMNGIIVGMTTGAGYRPTFVALPREAIRAFNAAMRAFREAQYQ